MPTAAPTEVDPATVIGGMSDPDAVTVLDVRSPAEFETGHIAGSHSRPLDLVSEHAIELAARLDGKVVLVRQFDVRAGQAQQRLAGTGMDNLHVLKSGVFGYAAGLTASALTNTRTIGRLLSALPYDRGTQTDAQKLLDQLPTAESVAGS